MPSPSAAPTGASAASSSSMQSTPRRTSSPTGRGAAPEIGLLLQRLHEIVRGEQRDAEEPPRRGRIKFTTDEPRKLQARKHRFLAADPELVHDDFVTHAWVDDPVKWLLARVSAYRR